MNKFEEIERKSTAEVVIGFMAAEAIAPLYNEMLGRTHDYMLVEQDNIMALRICRLLVNELDDRELTAIYGEGNVMQAVSVTYDGDKVIWSCDAMIPVGSIHA